MRPGVRRAGLPRLSGADAGPAAPRSGAALIKARDEAGLSALHLHDLRHTGNTMAAATGASLRELMERMGHSSTRAALIYQHATRERDQAIATAMGQLFASARKGTAKNRSDAPMFVKSFAAPGRAGCGVRGKGGGRGIA